MYGPSGPGFAPVPGPYAPPGAPPLYRQNVFVPPGTVAGPLPAPTLRNLMLAGGIGQVVMLLFMTAGIVMMAAGHDDRDVAQAGGAVMGISMLLWYAFLFAYSIANLVWIYKFWGWIPPHERYTNLWKKYISPGTAAGFMFIPYFNIYWMFVIYLGLGDVFERMRVTYPTNQPSPKNLAIAMLIVSMLFFPAAPFMHWLFAKRCEALAAEINAKIGAMPGAGAPLYAPGLPAV